MADYSDRKTEAELINLEKKLNRLYRRAWNEMRLETEEYFEQFSERYQREYEKYKAGQYTEQQFKAWYQAQVARGKTWEAKRDTLAMQMTHTNEIAAAYVNGTTPSIYALNANYAAYMTEQKYDVSFTLVNEDVIQNLVTEKSSAIEFKTMSVNPVRDYKWNSKQIQSALISGILQGQSIDKLADAFMVVQKRNRNAAVRNARTSVTSAQNAGRIDTMKRSQAMGIDIKKEWLSAHDGRVRDSHAVLNGQIRNIDEAFDNGLMYPADPGGIPAEVYNCRCTLKYVYPKYQNVQSTERYAQTRQKDESYQEWLKRKKDDALKGQSVVKSITIDDISRATKDTKITKQVSNEIGSVLKKKGYLGQFDNIQVVNKEGTTAFDTLSEQYANWAKHTLLVNENVLGGMSVKEVDEIFKDATTTVCNSLEDALMHECYHGKFCDVVGFNAYYEMGKEGAEKGLKGISKRARIDKTETMAEIGVLKERGDYDTLSAEAKKFYKQYFKED